MAKEGIANLNSPCKGCELRFMGCHMSCKSYNLFRQTVDFISKERQRYQEGYVIAKKIQKRDNMWKTHRW